LKRVAEVPVETTTIDVVQEPAPGVGIVTEYESVQTATPISPSGAPGREGTRLETEGQ
jgi:hypothetical protein